jgi:hypothetical protein
MVHAPGAPGDATLTYGHLGRKCPYFGLLRESRPALESHLSAFEVGGKPDSAPDRATRLHALTDQPMNLFELPLGFYVESGRRMFQCEHFAHEDLVSLQGFTQPNECAHDVDTHCYRGMFRPRPLCKVAICDLAASASANPPRFLRTFTF